MGRNTISHTLACSIAFWVEIFNYLAIEPEQQFFFPFPPLFAKYQLPVTIKVPNVIATVLLFLELGIDLCCSHIHSNENMPRFDPVSATRCANYSLINRQPSERQDPVFEAMLSEIRRWYA